MSTGAESPDDLPLLPPTQDLETKAILKACMSAHRHLAELKGTLASMPNQHILIDTLGLQEAKDSSAIENIITTDDDLYKTVVLEEFSSGTAGSSDTAAKEVSRYAEALKAGYYGLLKDQILANRHILAIQEIIEGNRAGFRTQSGTVLKNASSGEVVFTPPQNPETIRTLMDNLEKYINDPECSETTNVDPLIKMALIHFQFESIHPFYDGNGRTGRILNILYLVKENLLPLPVLYLSRYITTHKSQYYTLLRSTGISRDFEPWVCFMLAGIAETASQTLSLINDIKDLMASYKKTIRDNCKYYSQDLINVLFRYPYSTIKMFQDELRVSRITARNYLEDLSNRGLVQKHKIGRSNYYINQPLFDLLHNLSQELKSETGSIESMQSDER